MEGEDRDIYMDRLRYIDKLNNVYSLTDLTSFVNFWNVGYMLHI